MGKFGIYCIRNAVGFLIRYVVLLHLFCHIFLNIITATVLIMERFYKSTYNAITLGRVSITRTRIIGSIDGGIVHQWVIIATARHESNNSSCEQ